MSRSRTLTRAGAQGAQNAPPNVGGRSGRSAQCEFSAIKFSSKGSISHNKNWYISTKCTEILGRALHRCEHELTSNCVFDILFYQERHSRRLSP